MSAAALPRKRFTREEFEQMSELEMFAGQRYELIDGDLIDKMGQKAQHAGAIQLLLVLLSGIFEVRRIRVQSPIEVGSVDQKYNFPEPDVAVCTDYGFPVGERHPRGEELLIVVEVADTTVRGDLTIKRDLYARAGVPEYWVLNLKSRKLIVHRGLAEGRYMSVVTLTSEESVSIASRAIPVSEILP